jgi:hypothetical protein
MKVLELYGGSRSIGEIAKQRGHAVFSVDIFPFEGIDCVIDIENLVIDDVPFIPDVVWASPPCTTYSIASVSTHRDGQKPKTEFAEKSDRLIKHTLCLINQWGCIYYIENPVGMLRKMAFMRGMDRATVTYCTYGDIRMKPTDIWTNNLCSIYNPNGWHPRPKCHNNNPKCHHERAPRGSKTGTQGLNGDYERSIIPLQLCEEIIMYTEKLF